MNIFSRTVGALIADFLRTFLRPIGAIILDFYFSFFARTTRLTIVDSLNIMFQDLQVILKLPHRFLSHGIQTPNERFLKTLKNFSRYFKGSSGNYKLSVISFFEKHVLNEHRGFLRFFYTDQHNFLRITFQGP